TALRSTKRCSTESCRLSMDEGLIAELPGLFKALPFPGELSNKRLRAIDELLITERVYVADLDALQNYANEVKYDRIVDPETHEAILANLDQLADFQRRFLLAMESVVVPVIQIESLEDSYKAGLGGLFVENELEFAVYEPFCANLERARRLIVENNTQLRA